nr:MAG TPA: distal tail protein [Caudoviricetes sp.]
MSNRARQIVLEHKNETLSIQGDSSVQSDFYITDEGIEGWFSNPTAKVSASERTTGDGTHKVLESGVLYNSRTVTFSTYVLGEDRTTVVDGIKRLLYFSKKIIRIYVYDAEDCTYCDGYAKFDVDKSWDMNYAKVSVTVVCQDPVRLSKSVSRGYMEPSPDPAGGLQFKNSVLIYPLQWGKQSVVNNTCSTYNHGTIVSYPVITVSGDFPTGFSITNQQTGEKLSYSEPVNWGSPVIMYCSTRTASSSGVDVTRNLSERSFPSVQPGGDLSLSFLAHGVGTCEVVVHDAYI